MTVRSRRGPWLALAAAALFGASAPLAKALLASVEPQMLAGILYLGSGLGLLAFRMVRPAHAEAPLRRADLPWLAAAIAFGGVLGPLLLMLGVVRTPASGASLLLNLEGVLTALAAWFVFHENFDRRIALGMIAIAAGGVILTWQGHAEWGGILGPLAIAGACAAWAADNNLTQKVSAGDPVQIAMLKGVSAGTVNIAIALARSAPIPKGGHLAEALVIGLFSYGVSLVLFVRALRLLGTARTGAYFSTAPFVGAALAVVLLHDRVTPPLLIAAVCMLLGVWLHLSERHEHQHHHDVLDHEHAHVHDEHHQHQHGPNDPPVTDPEPHSHPHHHAPLTHAHPHYPDIHHRHEHN